MFRIRLLICSLFLLAITSGCQNREAMVYQEMIELNHRRAEVIEDSIAPQVKQNELRKIQRAIDRAEKRLNELQLSASRRAELEEQFKLQLEQSEERIRKALYGE